MAEYKVVDTEKLEAGLTATANAIREKTKKSEKIQWDNQSGMASSIDEVFKEGKTEGYNEGREAGMAEGVKTEYDRFWDAYQQNGQRSSYDYAFVNPGWNDETFKPKYDIIFTNPYCRNVFWQCHITDLAGILRNQNVVLDTSGAQYLSNVVGGSAVTRVPAISTLGAVFDGANSMFAYCGQLVEVEKVILPDSGAVALASAFYLCSKLTTITFEGTIGNDINFQWSPLSVTSINSVITHLSNTATGKTATFKLSAVNTAFESTAGAADGSTSQAWLDLIATKTNWTISLV